ncbi:hypothetical protein PSU4_24030 [Pseudonocardia sulfidoxydans NBRC 16205]|uniref:Uncharacterized protein n=1 Tax=Pseudonocardia sulfidoxydans NBRC 16205 TaxID=1223511 RepID=A0A511DF84_9PSEU|nr:hypothetical protein [Pseudonocardia sulfidoxydans]GEL23449.1 hypothetical protein PSU4_24030 [Pseudonocardia sulfidoxydans NBRC 16205]
MPASLDSRMAALARRDRILAITFTVLMWVVLVFVFFAATSVAPTPAITVVLAVATLLLGVFNTASLLALLTRYAANRDLIYRPDVMHLDQLRAARGKQD